MRTRVILCNILNKNKYIPHIKLQFSPIKQDIGKKY